MDQSFMAPFALPEIPSVGPDIWERAARQGRPAARRTVKLMGEIFNIALEKCSLQSAPERVLSPPHPEQATGGTASPLISRFYARSINVSVRAYFTDLHKNTE